GVPAGGGEPPGRGARALPQHLAAALALPARVHGRGPRSLHGAAKGPGPGLLRRPRRAVRRRRRARRAHRPDPGRASVAAGQLSAAGGHGGRAARRLPSVRLGAAVRGSGGAMKAWVRLLGSLALVGVLAWRLDWPRLAEVLGGARPGWWLAALAVYLLA